LNYYNKLIWEENIIFPFFARFWVFLTIVPRGSCWKPRLRHTQVLQLPPGSNFYFLTSHWNGLLFATSFGMFKASTSNSQIWPVLDKMDVTHDPKTGPNGTKYLNLVTLLKTERERVRLLFSHARIRHGPLLDGACFEIFYLHTKLPNQGRSFQK